MVIDSSHVRALKGGPEPGGAPGDRGRPVSKHHVIRVATGTPLTPTGDNRNNVTQLLLPVSRYGRPRP